VLLKGLLKMKILKPFLFLTFFFSLVFTSGCGESEQTNPSLDTRKVVIMATSADNPPYEFYETEGENNIVVGLDADLARAIADILNIRLEIQDMDFGGIISALQAGRADFAMAGITVTKERAQNVDFSDPYYTAQIAVIFKAKASPLNETNLKGKKIGVQLGTVHEQAVQKLTANDPGTQIIHFNKLGELIQEVLAERIDGAIMDMEPAQTFVSLNQELALQHLKGEDVSFAIAFPKGSPLVANFNAALNSLKQKDKIKIIAKKWLKQ
jgi:polar amino acid transport system substrate-binding protein